MTQSASAHPERSPSLSRTKSRDDWIIDLGPEGGDKGGEIVATGTPEAVVKVARSYTGRYLAPLLGDERDRVAAE